MELFVFLLKFHLLTVQLLDNLESFLAHFLGFDELFLLFTKFLVELVDVGGKVRLFLQLGYLSLQLLLHFQHLSDHVEPFFGSLLVLIKFQLKESDLGLEFGLNAKHLYNM